MKLVSTDLQIVLRTQYEQRFGIVNHSQIASIPQENAFALVTLNNNEDIYNNDIQKDRARKFQLLRVLDSFGVSYDRFIEMPKSTCDMLFELCEEKIKADKPDLVALEREFNKLNK